MRRPEKSSPLITGPGAEGRECLGLRAISEANHAAGRLAAPDGRFPAIKRVHVALSDFPGLSPEPDHYGRVPYLTVSYRSPEVERRRLLSGHCTCHLASPCPVCTAWHETMTLFELRKVRT